MVGSKSAKIQPRITDVSTACAGASHGGEREAVLDQSLHAEICVFVLEKREMTPP